MVARRAEGVSDDNNHIERNLTLVLESAHESVCETYC